MAIKQFKTESKRLLDLMANSIYTNTDIFLRELISNASDALDKKYFLSLTDTSINAENLKIEIELDKKARTITIRDNGIGMSKEDLENNLGTIAKSGSFDFKQEMGDSKDVDIIGQFGVGFYSAFMVADNIEVISKKYNEDKANLWKGCQDGYEVSQAKKDEDGTTIILHIKKNSKEKKYDQYLENYEILSLIRKYSDFITYPIEMDTEEYNPETKKTEKTVKAVNSMTPIWKKNKKDITDEDYSQFYKNSFYAFDDPLKTIHYKVEGNTSYTALIYIPKTRPFNYYSPDFKAGLKLYSRGVFIKDEACELCSDYFRFVKGIVDSDDLSLNISREILQQDYQMSLLKKSIDKKIKSALENMRDKQREDYEKFFDGFGALLKAGCYEGYGVNKDELIDLVMFKSTKEDKYVTLKEYTENMKDGQTDIYYAAGDSIEQIKSLPEIEKVLDKGYEVLYFTEPVDEFMANIVGTYGEKKFKSVQKGDLNLETEEEKEETKKKEEKSKGLLETLKNCLDGKVSEVRISTRLKSHPVCLVSDGEISIEMEKTLKQMNQDAKAIKILEINPDHELFACLEKAAEKNENLEEYAKLLYDQARLIAGLEIDDPADYAKRIADLMIKAMK